MFLPGIGFSVPLIKPVRLDPVLKRHVFPECLQQDRDIPVILENGQVVAYERIEPLQGSGAR